MSDSHDNKNKLREAISLIKEKNCKILIHCGDFTSPSILYEFKEFSGKVYGVFGNMDRDIMSMKKISFTDMQNIEFMGSEEGDFTLEGKKIAITHYPEIASTLGRSEIYDVIFYGHTHRYRVNKMNYKTSLINPGDINGRYGKSSFIFYDLFTEEIEKIAL